jgi:hypothetical protein
MECPFPPDRKRDRVAGSVEKVDMDEFEYIVFETLNMFCNFS